jgi:hypothetical protein
LKFLPAYRHREEFFSAATAATPEYFPETIMNQQYPIRRPGIFICILALAVLSCSGASRVSNFFATDTPTPTSTFTPSPTLTPSPTFTPTKTPIPSSTPAPTGSITEKQADGSTLFTDYENHYQMTLPKGWMIFPLNSENMDEMLQSMSEKPESRDLAESLRDADPNMIRLIAINMDAGYVMEGNSTIMTVMAIDNKVMSTMPMDFVLETLEEAEKQDGGKFLSNGNPPVKNTHEVEVGNFDYVDSMASSTGTSVPVHFRVIVFQAGGKMILVQLGTPQQFGRDVLPVMDQIQDSIKRIGK